MEQSSSHDRPRRSDPRAQPPPRRHRPQVSDGASGRCLAIRRRDRRPGGAVVDAVLEADGVILRRVALVDQNKIGLGISVFVSVESADHSEAWLRKFADAVSAMPEVMEFYRMAGDVDYMLRVVVADMQSYDVFYKKLIGAVPLKNVTSRFAMEKIKSVTALPIPAVA